MEVPWLTHAKEAKDCSISWVGHGLVWFLDDDGILMVEYLQNRQTINGTYYSTLLRHLREILKSSAVGNSVKVCCFARTMLQLTRLSLPWLSSIIVALN